MSCRLIKAVEVRSSWGSGKAVKALSLEPDLEVNEDFDVMEGAQIEKRREGRKVQGVLLKSRNPSSSCRAVESLQICEWRSEITR